ncbi:voltage-dependent calcium channel gamma-7 subunit-like isoform X1 [Phyllopteryx taeniolatus]|uniref:voltage-dependent calcium channel gamma-7 subunit-like isoform X1 n=2 Tax=Phyllopteryx taeniolatus TaxID=161469 RepID=UPI002AD5631E|nr:voltage-dependent calcium channel gamma-7 subunit-like isoform X1 [Phyllopteryx taeniolatus]
MTSKVDRSRRKEAAARGEDATSHFTMSWFSTRALTLLSSSFGGCGLLLVGAAVSSDYWLLMEEGVVLQQNQSTQVKMALHSGLWRVCFVAGPENGRCVASEYFSEPEVELTTENTANILKMVRTATPFPVVSLLFVFIAFVVSSVGHVRPQRTILAFVSGIFFILSGLSLVVGLVLYISSINDEVMNRPREAEQFFHYRYGWSFALAASSFLLKEGAGVMSVYLFMKRYAEEELFRPHPALYRPRLSDCSDYSGHFLHPDSWAPPPRSRSKSDVSSDISIQLNHAAPPSSSSSSSFQPHPVLHAAAHTFPRAPHGQPWPHLGDHLPMAAPPSAVLPPRYHAHVRMSASPC